MAGAAETGNTGGNVGICEHPCDHAKQVRQAFARPVRSAHNMKYLLQTHSSSMSASARAALWNMHSVNRPSKVAIYAELTHGVCPCYLPCAPCSPALQSSVNPNPAIHIIKTHTRTAARRTATHPQFSALLARFLAQLERGRMRLGPGITLHIFTMRHVVLAGACKVEFDAFRRDAPGGSWRLPQCPPRRTRAAYSSAASRSCGSAQASAH